MRLMFLNLYSCRARLPDEKGTEILDRRLHKCQCRMAARGSPMRRGLKSIGKPKSWETSHCRARLPDEKGTEMEKVRRLRDAAEGRARLPDEKGTEIPATLMASGTACCSRARLPDEKGTEMGITFRQELDISAAARGSPMRRGLKS